MKRVLPLFFIFLLFLAGIGLVVYPMVSNRLYEQNQSHVLAEYDRTVLEKQQQELEDAFREAQAYNQALLESEAILTDPFDPDLIQDPTLEPYASLLNLAGDGMMGYVEVPKIDVYLPIYHGTTTAVLEQGVGHLQSTSLPVGGPDTHTVLTGHTGLAGKRLFTDLTQVSVGDVFYLHILGQTLAYQVFQIEVVEPDDPSLLVVQSQRDLATLLTCTPYGLNTHRLLVMGERIDYHQAQQQQLLQTASADAKSVWKQEYRKAIILCLAVYVPLTLVVLIFLLYRKKENKSGRKTPGRYLKSKNNKPSS